MDANLVGPGHSQCTLIAEVTLDIDDQQQFASGVTHFRPPAIGPTVGAPSSSQEMRALRALPPLSRITRLLS
jgi:hypothetical protein